MAEPSAEEYRMNAAKAIEDAAFYLFGDDNLCSIVLPIMGIRADAIESGLIDVVAALKAKP